MKRYLFSIVILTILCMLVAFNEAAAQQSQQPQPQEKRPTGQQRQDQPQIQQPTGTLSRSDRDFVTKAAQGGMAEVALGELADRKTANNEVKQFAQRMIDDHSKANNELKDLASKEGIAFPSEMTAKQKAMKNRMAKLSGAAFDRGPSDDNDTRSATARED